MYVRGWGVALAGGQRGVVERLVVDLFRTGDAAIAEEVLAADYVDHTPSHPELRGVENVKRSVAEWRAAFPDTRTVVEDAVVEGETVAVRWRTDATHRGEFMGLPATGRRISVASFGFFRLSGGRIVESWDTYNVLELLEQLGVEPPRR